MLPVIPLLIRCAEKTALLSNCVLHLALCTPGSFTNHGRDVRLAQYVWLCLYLVTLGVVLFLYRKGGRVPLWAFVLLSCSRRIHSIFVLRLFNDCWAVFLSLAAFALFVSDFWTLGCVLFSLAVSVKMNILLFAPGLLLLLLKRFGLLGAVPRLFLACALPQVLLGFPFLVANWFGYVQRSFDLGRQFFYVWSVNWQFVPETLFLNRWFGLLLLALTASTCLLFALFKWTAPEEHFADILRGKYARGSRMTADHVLTTLFTSNFIGIVLARSLHFQFYVWYFFTLPYLLWTTTYPTPIRVAILGAIEVVWNVFPANAYASATLFIAHLAILAGLIATPLPHAYGGEHVIGRGDGRQEGDGIRGGTDEVDESNTKESQGKLERQEKADTHKEEKTSRRSSRAKAKVQ